MYKYGMYFCVKFYDLKALIYITTSLYNGMNNEGRTMPLPTNAVLETVWALKITISRTAFVARVHSLATHRVPDRIQRRIQRQ